MRTIGFKKMVFRIKPWRGNGIELRMGARWFDELKFVGLIFDSDHTCAYTFRAVRR